MWGSTRERPDNSHGPDNGVVLWNGKAPARLTLTQKELKRMKDHNVQRGLAKTVRQYAVMLVVLSVSFAALYLVLAALVL
jgi:hypothetical protein